MVGYAWINTVRSISTAATLTHPTKPTCVRARLTQRYAALANSSSTDFS
jgi:hypothetical protein